MIGNFRAAAPRILGALLFLGALLLAFRYRAAADDRATAAVSEMRRAARLAARVGTAEARLKILTDALRAGGDVPIVSLLESQAAAGGIGRLDSVTPLGPAASPPAFGKESRWEIRIARVRLSPLIRFLETIERARGGLVVREVTIRKAPESREDLEARVTVALFEP